MPVNYGLGERIPRPLMNEYIEFVHGVEKILIVRETWFHRNHCHEVIPKECFVERDTKEVRDYVNSRYPFILQEHKGKFETYLKEEITNHIGKLVIICIPIPDTSAPHHGTGSGNSEDLQKLQDKSQNIQSMSSIDRIILLLTLTFKKMGRNIFDSFSMSDLYMIAGIMVVWVGSQFIGVGELIDAALLAWLWWQIGWDCWHFLKIIIKALKTAVYADSVQQIDDAATELAPAAAALGIDALMGFILHHFGKGSAVEKAAQKEVKAEQDLVKTDLGKKPALRQLEEVTSKEFTPLGLSDAETMKVLESPMGQKMLQQYAITHPDMPLEDVRAMVSQGIQSGDTIPVEVNNFTGKILKIQSAKYPGVSPNTIYFTTQEELEKAAKIAANGGETIAQQLGLPSGSTLEQYNIMGMEAKNPATLFTSRIAPTIENGVQTLGGSQQYLIYDQTQFNALGKLGTITNKGMMGQ